MKKAKSNYDKYRSKVISNLRSISAFRELDLFILSEPFIKDAFERGLRVGKKVPKKKT